MRLLLLADANSPHVQKWVCALAAQEEVTAVAVFSLNPLTTNAYDGLPNVQIEAGTIPLSVMQGAGAREGLRKLGAYLRSVPRAQTLLRSFRPDVVQAHYASSYGLIGALLVRRSGLPYVVSVWGSDVYDFPKSSVLNAMLLRFNLWRANIVCSTSEAMAKETVSYTTPTKVRVIPFGVNTAVFRPLLMPPYFPLDSITGVYPIVIGTVKTMEPKYGIDDLLEAFSLLRLRLPTQPLKLLLVGGGTHLDEYRAEAQRLGIADDTVFTGRVPFTEVVQWHNRIDVFIALSVLDSESFGVAAVEAAACSKPVVCSAVAGFREVVAANETGIIVPKHNAAAAAAALATLVLSPTLRADFGTAGRARVKKLYEWRTNVAAQMAVYDDVLAQK